MMLVLHVAALASALVGSRSSPSSTAFAQPMSAASALRPTPTAAEQSATPPAQHVVAPSKDAAASTPAAPAIPPFAPSTLSTLDDAAEHGLAWLHVRGGDLDGALAALSAIAARTPPPPLAEHIAIDVERVRGLVALRDAWLERTRASGAKVSFELDGKKLVASIERVEGGRVHLAPNAKKVESIPISSLSAAFVARETDKKEHGADPLVRAFAFGLAGDARWEKLAKGVTPAGTLPDDLRTRYPALVRTGEAAAALRALAARSEPSTPEDAAACLAVITSLWTSASELPLVQRNRAALAQLAEAAAWRAFTERALPALVHGTLAVKDGGAVQLVYDFQRAEQAQDFVRVPTHFEAWRKKIGAGKGPLEASRFAIDGGVLRCAGAVCYRHRIAFQAPMTVRVVYQIDSAGESSDMTGALFTLCTQDDDRYVHCSLRGDLSVFDARAKHIGHAERSGSGPLFLDVEYDLEIRHDGTTVESWVDGEKQASAPAGPRTNGYVMLWFHTNRTFDVKRLEIEGRVDSAALRKDWIDARLTEAGLR